MSDDEILFNAVRDAWRATQPHEEFEPDRTLADAGVDSLKAMELVLRIERVLDRKVPYALLTAETTPRSLALGLARGGCLAPSVDKPLLFFMPNINGHPLNMVRSWQAVVEEMQLTLVDAPGFNRPRALVADLPATAAEVAAEIARRQPDGDIRLMGYSYGAALAYEVAGQLQAQGRRVAFLGLIDLLPVRAIFLRLAYALCSPAALGRKLAARLPRLRHIFNTIEEWTKTKTKFEVMDICNQHDIPVGPILSMKEIAEEPSLRATGTVVEVDHPTRGKYLTVGNPVKMSDSITEVQRAPLIGEHTAEILTEVLGYSAEEYAAIKSSGAITPSEKKETEAA